MKRIFKNGIENFRKVFRVDQLSAAGDFVWCKYLPILHLFLNIFWREKIFSSDVGKFTSVACQSHIRHIGNSNENKFLITLRLHCLRTHRSGQWFSKKSPLEEIRQNLTILLIAITECDVVHWIDNTMNRDSYKWKLSCSKIVEQLWREKISFSHTISQRGLFFYFNIFFFLRRKHYLLKV